MPIGRVLRDAGAPCHFPQGEGSRPDLGDQSNRGLQQCFPQISVVIRLWATHLPPSHYIQRVDIGNISFDWPPSLCKWLLAVCPKIRCNHVDTGNIVSVACWQCPHPAAFRTSRVPPKWTTSFRKGDVQCIQKVKSGPAAVFSKGAPFLAQDQPLLRQR